METEGVCIFVVICLFSLHPENNKQIVITKMENKTCFNINLFLQRLHENFDLQTNG
jgi:hypothetical protein